jgi:hypothetical protein
VLPQKCP